MLLASLRDLDPAAARGHRRRRRLDRRDRGRGRRPRGPGALRHPAAGLGRQAVRLPRRRRGGHGLPRAVPRRRHVAGARGPRPAGRRARRPRRPAVGPAPSPHRAALRAALGVLQRDGHDGHRRVRRRRPAAGRHGVRAVPAHHGRPTTGPPVAMPRSGPRSSRTCTSPAATARPGLPVTCLGGGDAVGFRMYPAGLRQLVEGWTKNIASGAGLSPPWALAGTVAWMLRVRGRGAGGRPGHRGRGASATGRPPVAVAAWRGRRGVQLAVDARPHRHVAGVDRRAVPRAPRGLPGRVRPVAGGHGRAGRGDLAVAPPAARGSVGAVTCGSSISPTRSRCCSTSWRGA